jgi:cytochrome c oxidase assembly protein subunit 15
MKFSLSFVRLQWATLILIYLVVIAGSFVRITGSGMGCPDWPKCFGQWIPPTDEAALPKDYKQVFFEKREKKIMKFCKFLRGIGMESTAKKIEKDTSLEKGEDDFNARKTWTEYINRLVGFLAGDAMLLSFVWILLRYRKRKIVVISTINLVLMAIQAWFGSIVVASNLVPWTITVHMFLALVIIGLQIYLIRQISEKQQGNVQLNKLMRAIAVIVLAITFYQMFLGTQVREYIDELTKMGFGRESWTDKLGVSFLIHRSFSWLVLGLIVFMAWKNEQGQKLWIIRSIFIVLALELTSGVLLAYANMPGLVQTSHLLFASVLFGILLMLVFRMKRLEA